MRPSHVLRMATTADARGVHDIYAPVVRDSAISFESEEPSVAEIGGRIEKTLSGGFPWIVAEADGRVSGYAYGGPFRTRTAYSWTAEGSVYVHPDFHRRGIGQAVYGALLRFLELQGFASVYGIATAPNPSSEGLHRALGFVEVGRWPRVGYKFGEWHDVICWHAPLAPRSTAPQGVRPIQEILRDASLEAALPPGEWRS